MNHVIDDETIATACLARLGVRPKSLAGIHSSGSSLRDFWLRPRFDLLKKKEREGLEKRSDHLWSHTQRLLQAHKVQILWKESPSYPILLKEALGHPEMLYIRGSIEALQARSPLAVVGTRKMSAYGERVLRRLIPPLVERGVTIVSGLAYGIDALAHEIALEHGGRCIAVFGTGVDRIYPAAHRGLAERILSAGGALVSELPLGTPALRQHFPARNRILSGLTKATLVIEAQERSGSLITAQFALDQNRDVYAVPGDLFRDTQQSTNALIAEGATPLLSAEQLLSDFGLQGGRASDAEQQQVLSFANDDEQRLFELLVAPQSADQLVQLTTWPIARVSVTLTSLELRGLILQNRLNQWERS